MQRYQRFLLYQELRMALHSLVQYGLALMRQLAFGAEQKATALISLAHCLHTSGDLATTAAYQLLGKEIEVIMMCTWRNLLVTEQVRFLFWRRVLHFKSIQPSLAGMYICAANYDGTLFNQSVDIRVTSE